MLCHFFLPITARQHGGQLWKCLTSCLPTLTSLFSTYIFIFLVVGSILPAFALSKSSVWNSHMDKYLSHKVISRLTSDAGSQYRCGRVGRGSQPPSTPNTHSNTDTYTRSFKTLVFLLFDSCSWTNGPTDQQTDGPTDQRTDKASYRVACPQLKISFFLSFFLSFSPYISTHTHTHSPFSPGEFGFRDEAQRVPSLGSECQHVPTLSRRSKFVIDARTLSTDLQQKSLALRFCYQYAVPIHPHPTEAVVYPAMNFADRYNQQTNKQTNKQQTRLKFPVCHLFDGFLVKMSFKVFIFHHKLDLAAYKIIIVGRMDWPTDVWTKPPSHRVACP